MVGTRVHVLSDTHYVSARVVTVTVQEVSVRIIGTLHEITLPLGERNIYRLGALKLAHAEDCNCPNCLGIRSEPAKLRAGVTYARPAMR